MRGTRTANRITPQSALKTAFAPSEHNGASPRGSHPGAQNKVLVIMDDAIFRKQAYRGTGCQRGSRPGGVKLATFPQPAQQAGQRASRQPAELARNKPCGLSLTCPLPHARPHAGFPVPQPTGSAELDSFWSNGRRKRFAPGPRERRSSIIFLGVCTFWTWSRRMHLLEKGQCACTNWTRQRRIHALAPPRLLAHVEAFLAHASGAVEANAGVGRGWRDSLD